MAKSKASRKTRFVTRVKHVAHRARKAKPSVAVLGGLAVGPLEAVFGTNNSYGNQGPVWSYGGNKAQELWNRIQITYTGGMMGGTGGYDFKRAHGSQAAIAGFAIHAIANWTGANRVLARMKLPFRI